MAHRSWSVVGVMAVMVGATGGWLAKMAAEGEVPSLARDLACDGHVGAGEWMSAGLDHGWRRAIDAPADCMEVFSLKDGMPQALWCGVPPRCQPGAIDRR